MQYVYIERVRQRDADVTYLVIIAKVDPPGYFDGESLCGKVAWVALENFLPYEERLIGGSCTASTTQCNLYPLTEL